MSFRPKRRNLNEFKNIKGLDFSATLTLHFVGTYSTRLDLSALVEVTRLLIVSLIVVISTKRSAWRNLILVKIIYNSHRCSPETHKVRLAMQSLPYSAIYTNCAIKQNLPAFNRGLAVIEYLWY